jgi:threonylcarbamoyladenosine tRNA methylthiotransferase MtaB
MHTVALHTLGCKLNYAETATIGKQFLDRGYRIVEFGTPADVYVINTCSVTERADRECRQLIRRASRTSADAYVIVTGCYAQLAPEEVASIGGVDLVLGAREKFELFLHAETLTKRANPRVCVSDIDTVQTFGPAYSTAASERTRAFLKVQDGCDYNCSFCTIPLARGASRSQPIDECLSHARDLVALGYKEIVLTGVNVGDYGKKSGSALLALLEKLTRLEGLERIRISSIEPNLLSQEIIDFVAETPTMCNHFHIPLQSGADEILRAMRRRYTSNRYADLITRIKKRIPDCGIGADVIVGFPGESDRHFEETYFFLNELPVSYLHVFTYSERENTPAAGFNNVLEPKVRFRRNEMLRILAQKKKHVFYSQMVGQHASVLFEGETDAGLRFGLTENYVRVGVPAKEAGENTIVDVEINDLSADGCIGKIISDHVAV